VAFTTVTITQDYDLADGTDPAGQVTFTPTAPMVNSGVQVPAAPVLRALDIDGGISCALVANTDSGTTPAGTAYLVEELINGVARSYYVTVPHDQGSSLTLANLASVGVAPALTFPAQNYTLATVDGTYTSPLALASPTLVAPLNPTGASAAVWPAVNRALFMRFNLPVPTTMRYLNWVCSVQSGNVQVGVVSLSGANRTSYSRVMSSGVIACPAAANIRTDLGATALAAGSYAMFLWADNTTFQTRNTTGGAYRYGGIHSSLSGGVTTSGTLTWDTVVVNMSLEGDV